MTSDFRLSMLETVSKYRTLKENLRGFESFNQNPLESAIIPKTSQLLKTINHTYWNFFNFEAKNDNYCLKG